MQLAIHENEFAQEVKTRNLIKPETLVELYESAHREFV